MAAAWASSLAGICTNDRFSGVERLDFWLSKMRWTSAGSAGSVWARFWALKRTRLTTRISGRFSWAALSLMNFSSSWSVGLAGAGTDFWSRRK